MNSTRQLQTAEVSEVGSVTENSEKWVQASAQGAPFAFLGLTFLPYKTRGLYQMISKLLST